MRSLDGRENGRFVQRLVCLSLDWNDRQGEEVVLM